MKKKLLLFGGLLAIGLSFFASCSDKEDEYLQPNEWPDERAQLFLIEEDDQGIPFVTTRLTPADAIKGANDIE